jgi:hypothetical protein
LAVLNNKNEETSCQKLEKCKSQVEHIFEKHPDQDSSKIMTFDGKQIGDGTSKIVKKIGFTLIMMTDQKLNISLP